MDRGTRTAGYCVYLEYPDGSSGELSEACGENSSNYDAEIAAIEEALHLLKTQVQAHPKKKQNLVIFTDAMSALESLDDDPTSKPELKSILLDAHELIATYGVKTSMQWIPGHSNTPGNDKADTLAKKGSRQPQPNTNTTFQTVKQILRANTKEEWLNGWTLNQTGRELFKHMAAPNKADPINALNRKDQSTIFRLRTRHIALNKHLHRIGANATPACPLCNHPEESVEHHLHHCTPLDDLRTCYLPPQIKKTSFMEPQRS